MSYVFFANSNSVRLYLYVMSSWTATSNSQQSENVWWLQGRTGKFEGPVRNNGLGLSGLVQDREYQAIAAGKRNVLCESTIVRSHTCDWQLNHHKKPNNYFFWFRNNFFCCWNNCYCLSDKKNPKKSLF